MGRLRVLLFAFFLLGPTVSGPMPGTAAAAVAGPVQNDVKIENRTVAPGAEDLVDVPCAAGEALVGGGFDGLGGGEGLAVAASHPTAGAWELDVRNPTSVAREYQALAVCWPDPALSAEVVSTSADVGAQTQPVTVACPKGEARGGGGFAFSDPTNAGVTGSHPQTGGQWTVEAHGDQRPVIRDVPGSASGSASGGGVEGQALQAGPVSVTVSVLCVKGLKPVDVPVTSFALASTQQCSGGGGVFLPTCAYTWSGHAALSCGSGTLVAGGYQLTDGQQPAAFPAIEDVVASDYEVSIEGSTSTDKPISYDASAVCLASAGSSTSTTALAPGGTTRPTLSGDAAAPSGPDSGSRSGAGSDSGDATKSISDWFKAGSWKGPAAALGALLLAFLLVGVLRARARARSRRRQQSSVVTVQVTHRRSTYGTITEQR
jgi:hypothetical protein